MVSSDCPAMGWFHAITGVIEQDAGQEMNIFVHCGSLRNRCSERELPTNGFEELDIDQRLMLAVMDLAPVAEPYPLDQAAPYPSNAYSLPAESRQWRA
jgi:hypothetical protein